jgi:hypothetical protein
MEPGKQRFSVFDSGDVQKIGLLMCYHTKALLIAMAFVIDESALGGFVLINYHNYHKSPFFV